MPVLGIPNDEPEEEIVVEVRDNDFYREYLDVPSWKCASCRLVNFGRNLRCAVCRVERGVE